jgi:DNA polymerase-3 subunit beta
MNVTCTVEKLKNAVALADRMTGKQLTLPVLHAIYISAQGGQVVVRSTNLAVGVEIAIPAKVQTEGVVVVKGDVVASVCNNLPPNTEITLMLENDNLVVRSQKIETVIKSLPPEEFPALPTVEGDSTELRTATLIEGIRSVYFAAALTEIKPEIASIYIYSEANTLYFVATDSFRLAEKKFPAKGVAEISKILIPYKNVADVLKVLDMCGETLTLSYTRTQCAIKSGSIYFTSRLIDGGFPPYQLIIPKEETTKVVLMKQDLIHTLRLSTVFADKFLQVAFRVDPTQKQVSISSKNTDVGSADATVDAVVEGQPIEVVCNLKYFLDVFQALPGDSLSISFTAPNKPIVIKSVSDTSFLYLLMPTNR